MLHTPPAMMSCQPKWVGPSNHGLASSAIISWNKSSFSDLLLGILLWEKNLGPQLVLFVWKVPESLGGGAYLEEGTGGMPLKVIPGPGLFLSPYFLSTCRTVSSSTGSCFGLWAESMNQNSSTRYFTSDILLHHWEKKLIDLERAMVTG